MPGIIELTFLLQSGSDRIGTLDFQASTQYVPRFAAPWAIMDAAALIEQGVPLTAALDQALDHSRLVGGVLGLALSLGRRELL